MTIEQFNETGFHAGMKFRDVRSGETYLLASVDFEEALIGAEAGETECEECGAVTTDIRWMRCEHCEIIEEGM